MVRWRPGGVSDFPYHLVREAEGIICGGPEVLKKEKKGKLYSFFWLELKSEGEGDVS